MPENVVGRWSTTIPENPRSTMELLWFRAIALPVTVWETGTFAIVALKLAVKTA
jgi:hypothetical protein